MFILQLVGWFVFSCVLMSFIEHQVHSRMMHRRTLAFKRTFEAHAILHHQHYSKIFTDEPVAPGEDREIRLNVHRAPQKAWPFLLLIGIFSWQGALIFLGTVCLHHWIWNKIHLEMHKPEGRAFSRWPAYKFLERYHWMHHKHPDKNFNVVFPLADYILGTNAHASELELREMQLQLAPQPVKVVEHSNMR